MQSLTPTRPTDLSSTSLRDLLAGCESPLTRLIHARFGVREPEPVGRVRGEALAALVCGQTLADRLTPMRWVTAAEALAHEAPAVHVATALGLEIDEVTPKRRSRTHGKHQRAGMSAATRDEVHALPDDREAGR